MVLTKFIPPEYSHAKNKKNYSKKRQQPTSNMVRNHFLDLACCYNQDEIQDYCLIICVTVNITRFQQPH